MADERKNKEGQSRRTFLKVGTVAVGGVVTVVVTVPLVREFLYPVGRHVVSTPDEPIDVGLKAEELEAGGAPVRVKLVASSVRDAWNVESGVAVGSAWLRRNDAGEILAFTSVCPHLGCAIDFSEGEAAFRCPCHKSAFALDGEKQGGPAKRGLDPLPVSVGEEGRIKVTFKRFRLDIAERVEA